jgi:hypothetical protein
MYTFLGILSPSMVSCSSYVPARCNLQCEHFLDRGFEHPYIDPDIAQMYGPTATYTGKLPIVPEIASNAAHYIHMLSTSSSNVSTTTVSRDIEVPISESQHDSLWYDHLVTQPNFNGLHDKFSYI